MATSSRIRFAFHVALSLSAAALPVACGDDDDDENGSLEQTGSACTAPEQCFPKVEEGGAILGTVVCLDRVTGGYCTHECTTDADCCAVPGECLYGLPQVCSPFESADKKYCFLSCEEDDIRDNEKELFGEGDEIDANLFCERRANAAFKCRSSGGGSENRKVCTP